MSGSPKYSAADIATNIAEGINTVVQQHRAAEAERSRRRVEEIHRQQVLSTRASLLKDIRAFAISICKHRQASYGQWTSGLEQLTDLEVLTKAAEDAHELSVLESVRHQMEGAKTAVQRIVYFAQNEELAERSRQELKRQHAEAVEALSSVDRKLAETDPQLASKFDPSGAKEIQALICRIKTAIGDELYGDAIEGAKTAIALSDRHRKRVLQAEHEWLEKHQTARDEYHKTEVLFRSACDDRIVTAWRRHEVDGQSIKMREASDAIEREAWDVASAILQQVHTDLERLSSEAVKREEEEAQRRYITSSVIAVLNEQGFYTDRPCLLSDDPNSDVIIQAMRSDQRSLQIGIQRQGRVRYEVDGTSRVLTPGPGSKVTQECPEAESAILALHKQLETDFGINMEDLSWEGKPLNVSQVDVIAQTGRKMSAG